MGSVGTKDNGTKWNFDATKAGANYQSLPYDFQTNIVKNLSLSDAMRDNINSDKPVKMTDEWVTSLRGTREKRKVITEYRDGKLYYTVKSGNKILLKDGTVEQAVNQVATFYKNALARAERR